MRHEYLYKLGEDALMVRLGYCLVASRPLQATSSDKIVGRIEFGEGLRGGECPFVPAGEEEDDGYISTFVSRSDGTGTSDEEARVSCCSCSCSTGFCARVR